MSTAPLFALLMYLGCLVWNGPVAQTWYTCHPLEGTEKCIMADGNRPIVGSAASYVGAFRLGQTAYLLGVGLIRFQDHGVGWNLPDSEPPWVDLWTPNSRAWAFEQGVIVRDLFLVRPW